jgi:Site-specific recombinase XerD
MIKKRNIYYKNWIHEWLENKQKYVKESTFSNYNNLIYNHIIPSLGNFRLMELNNELLQQFIFLKADDLSPKTLKNIMSIVKSSIGKAIKENKIKQFDLLFTYPNDRKKRTVEVFEQKEQRKLLHYCNENISNANIGIMLCLFTGIRIGELSALQWRHIDLKNNIISIELTLQRIYTKNENSGKSKVIITSPKTISSIRQIPISKDFAALLKSIRGNSNDYLISGNSHYVEPRTYRRYFKKVLMKIRIRTLHFHSLRHSFATNCISLKIDPKTVSELLGHNSVQTTLNLYVHPTMKEKTKCINQLYKSLL